MSRGGDIRAAGRFAGINGAEVGSLQSISDSGGHYLLTVRRDEDLSTTSMGPKAVGAASPYIRES